MKNVLQIEFDRGSVYLNKDTTIAASYFYREKKIVVWILHKDRSLFELNDVMNEPIQFSPTENKLLFLSKSLAILNVDNGYVVSILPEIQSFEIGCCDYSKDGETVAVSCFDGYIYLWNVKLNQIGCKVFKHSVYYQIQFVSSQNQIVCASIEDTLHFYDAALSSKYEKNFEDTLENVLETEQNILLFFIGSHGKALIESIDKTTYQTVEKRQLLSKIWCAKVSPNNQHLATGCVVIDGNKHSVIIYDYKTLEMARAFTIRQCLNSNIISVGRLYWHCENKIYLCGRCDSFATLQLVDFEQVVRWSVFMLRQNVTAYIVLDVINFLLANFYKTSFNLESNLLPVAKIAKISTIAKQLRANENCFCFDKGPTNGTTM